MGTEKRARQKANRAKKLEQEFRVEQRSQRRHYVTVGLLAALGLGGALFLFSLTGGDDAEDVATDTQDETTAPTLNTSTTVAPIEGELSAVSAPAPGAAIDGPADCPAEDGSSERVTSFTEAPPTCIDPAATYSAKIETTLGTIDVVLDPELAPEAVNNFVFLARYHYYDGVPFHRIKPGFVVQGGDAVGEPLGTGNPGYFIAEEPPAEGAYKVGSLAMAKGPGDVSTGSQFFFVTGADGEALPPLYSLFGEVDEGLEIVLEIDQLPTNPEDQPTEEIYIDSVTITES